MLGPSGRGAGVRGVLVIRLLPAVLEIGLLVYCLVDCLQTDAMLVRNLPKLGWVVLIIVLPLIGGIAWLVAGRPERSAGRPVVWRSTATAGFPEYERPFEASAASRAIDERLREEQAKVDREHEEALRRWERSLIEREARLQTPEPPAALD